MAAHVPLRLQPRTRSKRVIAVGISLFWLAQCQDACLVKERAEAVQVEDISHGLE